MDRLIINADQGKYKINKNIYGHFSEHLGRCIYDGFWVGEDSSIPNVRGIRRDIVEALRDINIPVLRWPGGNFADNYHWQQGIGPKTDREEILNADWGMVIENNHFGTHEFMDLCDQLGCDPYICGNVGSGSVREMKEWVEYITFDGRTPMAELRRKNGKEDPWRLPFWGIGNENWGAGGSMRPQYYADLYRRFQTYVRDYSGNNIKKIACGPKIEYYEWTEVLMREAAEYMWGLALHYYVAGQNTRSATDFGEDDWFHLFEGAWAMKRLVENHSTIMDKYDPDKKVALVVDEWGGWHDPEPGTKPGFLYQQNTLRDAVAAGVILNIFNNHCQRVKMANIAQTVNVLQAMILTEGEKMILTPTYHIFKMYKVHQGATLLPINLNGHNYKFKGDSVPALSASASRDKEDNINISICNLEPESYNDLEIEIRGQDINPVKRKVNGKLLTAPKINSYNTFSNPEIVKPIEFKDFRWKDDSLYINIPSKSVLVVQISN
ncbi:MAG: alpha-N-arabinofuranosidase [Halanaerobiaceae bacterium]